MAMTTDELIELLKEHPGKMVVLAKDGEGNDFSPLADAGEFKYWAHSTWSGECPHPDDLDTEYDPEDVAQMKDVVLLWPTN